MSTKSELEDDVKPTKLPTFGGVKPHTMPLYIRATNPYGFRCGQWARVLGVEQFTGTHGATPTSARPVFIVQFVDGKTDWWPVYDPADPYEFSTAVGA